MILPISTLNLETNNFVKYLKILILLWSEINCIFLSNFISPKLTLILLILNSYLFAKIAKEIGSKS